MKEETIFRYFLDLGEEQRKQFSDLYELYKEWNQKINVISRKDIDNLYMNHVLHSLAIAKVIQFEGGTEVLDVGTGGGFPGIPLAIMFPDVNFHLVDSIGKKLKVVEDVAQQLDLKNVRTTHSRAEDIDEQYDFIVSRAVTKLDVFRGWVKGKLKKESVNPLKNGILYLKGGDFEQELKGCNYKLHPIEPMFGESYFQDKFVVYIEAF